MADSTSYKTQLALILGLMETRVRMNAYDDLKQVKSDDANIIKVLRGIHQAMQDTCDSNARAGSVKSEAKRLAAIENGKKGGRHKQHTDEE